MNYEYYTIIIGAGSGGLVVASGCAAFGAKTALVEGNKMGGDCLNTGCVPSKTFLRTAHIADFITHANEFALKADLKKVDISRVMKRVDQIIKVIEPHDSKKRYESMGVKIFSAKASLINRHTVKAGNKKIKGSHLLVASGRGPAVEGLGLDNIGIKTDERGYIITNRKMQTNIKNIYSCGDVTGPFQFTHMAGYQAGIVVRNIIFPFKTRTDYSSVVWTTYTKPEVAHVGYTEPMAKKTGLFKNSVIININEIDRALAEKNDVGFLKLNLDKKNRVIGATMINEKAGEMLPLATMAVKKRLKVSVFAGLIYSYPTEAEIFKSASFKILRNSFKPWMKKVIKFLFIN